MEIWTSRPVGPILSPSASCRAIIRYTVCIQRIGRQYSATVTSLKSLSSATRNRTSASSGHVTVNCFVSSHTGLKSLFSTFLVLWTCLSAGIPWISICNNYMATVYCSAQRENEYSYCLMANYVLPQCSIAREVDLSTSEYFVSTRVCFAMYLFVQLSIGVSANFKILCQNMCAFACFWTSFAALVTVHV